MRRILYFIVLSLFPVNIYAADWQIAARKLYHPNTREEGVKELSTYGGLDGRLTYALEEGEDRTLAAEVVWALKKKYLAPDMAKAAPKDPSGRVLIRLIALDREARFPETKALFKDLREKQAELPVALRFVVISDLPGVTEQLHGPVLAELLANESHELRMAAAYRFAQGEEKGDPAEWKALLASQPYQVRRDAIAALAERPSLPAGVKPLVKSACKSEKTSEVKAACQAAGSKHVL